MKFSDGLSRPLPAITFLLLFLLGATLQDLGFRAFSTRGNQTSIYVTQRTLGQLDLFCGTPLA